MHLPPKAQDISAGQRSDRRVHPLLYPRAAPDKDWPGSALASPGQSLIRLFYPLQASFLYCPHNMGRFTKGRPFFYAPEGGNEETPHGHLVFQASMRGLIKLRPQESNLRWRSQSPLPYRLAMAHYKVR